MSLKIKVKAGNISHLTDARYFSAMMVDYLGFPTSEMTPLEIKEIIPWVSGPEMVLEFNESASIDSIFTYQAQTEVELIQIPFKNDLEVPTELNCIYVHKIDNISEWEDVTTAIKTSKNAVYHLLEFSNISYAELELKIKEEIKSLQNEIPLMIDIALAESDVLKFYETWPKSGLHLKGSKEDKVGQKAYDLMDAILEGLEE